MSRLEFYARPLVAFDPWLKQHRQIYYKFVESSSWGHSPYRFIVPEDHGADLVTMMQRSLIEYYVKKEFGKTASKLQPVVRQRTQQLVDKGSKE